MINYIKINNRSFLDYLPVKQMKIFDPIILLHIKDEDGWDYFCFYHYKEFDTIFLYYDIHDGRIKEYMEVPVNHFLKKRSYIVKNSSYIGKTMKGIEKNE